MRSSSIVLLAGCCVISATGCVTSYAATVGGGYSSRGGFRADLAVPVMIGTPRDFDEPTTQDRATNSSFGLIPRLICLERTGSFAGSLGPAFLVTSFNERLGYSVIFSFGVTVSGESPRAGDEASVHAFFRLAVGAEYELGGDWRTDQHPTHPRAVTLRSWEHAIVGAHFALEYTTNHGRIPDEWAVMLNASVRGLFEQRVTGRIH